MISCYPQQNISDLQKDFPLPRKIVDKGITLNIFTVNRKVALVKIIPTVVWSACTRLSVD